MEILVKVIPWSKKIDVIFLWKDKLTNKDIYKIKLTAKAINNQANKQLIEVLEKYFKTKRRYINILKWDTNKFKLLKIVEN